MDNPDQNRLEEKTDWLTLDRLPGGLVFPASLWGADGATRRSRELTPLYAQRLVAPRESPELGSHPFWEVVYVFRGRGEMRGAGAGRGVPMRAGNAVMIPPGVAHREWAEREIDTLWIGLRGERTAALTGRSMSVVSGDELAGMCERLWLCGRLAQPGSGFELDGLALTLFARLLRLMRGGEPEAGDGLVDRAVRHMHQRLSEPMDVASLAAMLGCSEGHFYRRFKAQTGQTPVEYLTRLRVETATQLMRESRLPVSRLASLVGYSDPLYFSRVYRRATGRSPREAARRLRRGGTK